MPTRRHDLDDALVQLLSAGFDAATAARRSGCCERTVRRRLTDPAFRARIEAVRCEVSRRVVDRLTDAATRAVRVLRRLLSSSSERVQLGAATAILSAVRPAVETMELRQRVEDLERRLAGGGGEQPAPPAGPAGAGGVAGTV